MKDGPEKDLYLQQIRMAEIKKSKIYSSRYTITNINTHLLLLRHVQNSVKTFGVARIYRE